MKNIKTTNKDIEQIKNADLYMLITIRGEDIFATIQSKIGSGIDSEHKILTTLVQAMLGGVTKEKLMEEKPELISIVLLLFAQNALMEHPHLLEQVNKARAQYN